jgi:hemoglobin
MAKRQDIAALATLMLLAGCGGSRASTPSITQTFVAAPLYKRLGGYDALAAVTDDFLKRVHADTMLAPFFGGIPPEGMNRIRQMVVDQLCAASGGPCVYVGKSMKDAHLTLEISDDVFERFVGHIRATLIAFGVPSREQNEVMGALQSMKGDIVKRPGPGGT